MTPLKEVLLLVYDYCAFGSMMEESPRKELETAILEKLTDGMPKGEVMKAVAF